MVWWLWRMHNAVSLRVLAEHPPTDSQAGLGHPKTEPVQSSKFYEENSMLRIICVVRRVQKRMSSTET